MLGFDVHPKESARLLSEWKKASAAENSEMQDLEDEILNIFVDICSLFRREPEVNHRASAEEPSAEVYLFAYLRVLETSGEGLPPVFVVALRRALSHYGVKSLERSPKLEHDCSPMTGCRWTISNCWLVRSRTCPSSASSYLCMKRIGSCPGTGP